MKVILHGGFFPGFFSKQYSTEDIKVAKQKALKEMATDVYRYLEAHNAFESAIYGATLLEDNPMFNAGTGSMLQSDGVIRMSAAVMDGHTKKMSGVLNIEQVKNPILVAKTLIEKDDRILGGESATQYARKVGFEVFDTEIPERRGEYEAKLKSKGHGTIGCVVQDKEGHLSAATSTGGKGFELPGRISDSPTVAGNYADEYCGISCTGIGEDIVSAAVAAKIATRVSDGQSLKTAFDKSLAELKEIDGFCGMIAIDKEGHIWHDETHPTMVFACFDGSRMEIFH